MSAILCLSITSCVKEQIINDTDTPRHQIQDLKVLAGDEEVTLSWTVPEGWEPTDYKITYSDDASVTQTLFTDGKTMCTITGLVNDFPYTFNVQAVYGKAISNVVKGTGKPVTSRIPVAALNFVTADKEQTQQYIQLTWDKPSELVLNYTLTYYPEMSPDKVVTKTIDKDATSYRIEGVTNGDNYAISLVANYPKGAAPEAKTTVYFKMAYVTSSTVGAVGQKIDFTFNKEAYPDATDITWKFPDGTTQTGESVTWTITTFGKKQVVLSAKVGANVITWPGIDLDLREWVVATRDFQWDNKKCNGFKGSYPVFSPDGKTVYVITFNYITGLYAFDIQTGTEKWRYLPEKASASYNPCTVNPVTGDIYFGTTTAKQFYCVTPEGQLKWSFDEAAGNMQSTAPAVSADGTVVYIIDKNGNTFALDAATGAKKWDASLGKQGGSLLVNGNDLIVAICDTANSIQFLNASDGSVISTISLSHKPTDISGMAVSDDRKFAYIPLQTDGTTGGMAKIDLAARTLVKEVAFGANNMYAPAVSSNGYLVVGSKDGCVYGMKDDLSGVVWTYVHTGTMNNNVFNYSHMCADTEGHVMITAGQKAPMNNIVFDAASGAVVNAYIYETGSHNAERQMGGNNFLDGVLYSVHMGANSAKAAEAGAFIGKYIGGTRKFWGGPGGDICGSCCVQSPLL